MFKSIISIIDKYNINVPRYTSYPTAPYFTSITSKDYELWLKELSIKDALSLYFHIPFCYKLCSFCGCHTKIINNDNIVEQYFTFLLKEIEMVSMVLKEKFKVSHIHFGGGSPTILSPNLFQELMSKVRQYFDINENAEIAIEVDPRNVSEEKIRAYKNEGVNRISIGVQDFNLEVQQKINRVQSFELVEKIINQFRNCNITDINLDLIYGLPLQTKERIKRNVDLALALKPSRIALFGYAHVPWIKPHMNLIKEEDLPNNIERFILFKTVYQELLDKGFVAIGLDHFAQKDDNMAKAYHNKKLTRNFQGYTVDTAKTLIGFGASAIGDSAVGYVQNIISIKSYKEAISQGEFATYKGIKVSSEDKLRREVIQNLMCYMEVDLAQICKSFNYSENFFQDIYQNLQPFIDDDLIEFDGSNLKVKTELQQIVRKICSIFDGYINIPKNNGKKHKKYSKMI